jgi:hypothetical protein
MTAWRQLSQFKLELRRNLSTPYHVAGHFLCSHIAIVTIRINGREYHALDSSFVRAGLPADVLCQHVEFYVLWY